MTFRESISHECKTRLWRAAALVSLAFYAAALIYGAVNGRMERDARSDAIAQHQADVATKMQAWLTDLSVLEEEGAQGRAPPWSGSAMDVVFSSSLPPGPLADFAIGQSDLLPYVGVLSLWDPDIRLFSRYEFEDPVSLAYGAFDLSKAIIFVLPILLIVLCFDVLSADRDACRLSLIAAQGARIRSLCWRRLLIRSGMVLTLTFVVALSSLIMHAVQTSLAPRLPLFALWALAVLLYSGFWVAAIGFVAGKNRRGEINILLLLLVWTALTLVVPASVTAITEVLYPTPSRLAYLTQSRETEIATELAEAKLTKQSVLDHPELAIDNATEMPAYVRTAFLVTTTVDDATRPIMSAFETAAAQRDETLSVLRYVSPAIILHGFFNDIAGTSAARHRRYMTQARVFKSAYAEQIGPYVMSGTRLRSKDVASLPEFHFDDELFTALVERNIGVLLFLALATTFLLTLADRRLRRVSVLEAVSG